LRAGATPPASTADCPAGGLHAQYKYLEQQIDEVEKALALQLKDDDLGTRLMTVPGIGPITASLLSAELGDGKQYACGRDFAASVGLVPRQYSTGGRATLLGISKRGDKALRRLLVQCALLYGVVAPEDWSHGRMGAGHADPPPSNMVACALANTLARTVWALAAKPMEFRERQLAARG
jgi:transposase